MGLSFSVSSSLKHEPNSIKNMQFFEKLVDMCTEDSKQSAIRANKWSPDWETGTKQSCRLMLATYMVGRKIEMSHPKEFDLALEELD